MKYQTHTTTNPYLDLVRKHKEPYTTTVLNKEIIVYTNVMSPKYDWSSRFHIENMPNQKGKTFLEVGCGSGVLSLFAGLQGAKRVVAIDINENAIKNTQANFEKYALVNAEALYSDLFKNVTDTFDTINFAAPYHGNKPTDILEHGVSDENYKTLRSFLGEAKNYLAKDGQIVLGFSDTGDGDLLNQLIIENKYLVKEFHEEENEGWKAYLYVLEPVVFNYELEQFIYEDDYEWFKKYKEIVSSGKVLKVGYGLGYSSYFMKRYNPEITSVDITRNKHAIFSDDVRIYSGEKLPFKDKEFDTVVCTYTLHHIERNEEMLKELARVAKKNIVIIEETYDTLFQKIDLVVNCWRTNRGAGQKVAIHWQSYFSRDAIKQLFKKYLLTTAKHVAAPRRSFHVELFILENKAGI